MTSDWRSKLAHRAQLLDAVRTILIEVLVVEREPDELDPDALLFGSGLGLDSIDALDLVVRVEARFDIQGLVPDRGQLEGALILRTLNTIVDRVLVLEGTP